MEGDDQGGEDMQEAGLSLKLSSFVDVEADRAQIKNPDPRSPPPPPLEPSLTLALPVGDRAEGSKACSTSGGASTAAEAAAGSRRRSDAPRRYLPAEAKRSEDDEEEEEEEEEEDGGGAVRKKLRLSKEQSALLEDKFREHSTLNPKQKQALARQLKLRPRQVEVWFQNRRARTKLKRTEVEYELLKKCCETLKDENRRLQRELNELRYSIKASGAEQQQQPPRYAPAAAAAAFSMCPLCRKAVAAATGGDDGDDESGSSSVVAAASPRPPPRFFNPFAHSYTSFN